LKGVGLYRGEGHFLKGWLYVGLARGTVTRRTEGKPLKGRRERLHEAGGGISKKKGCPARLENRSFVNQIGEDGFKK